MNIIPLDQLAPVVRSLNASCHGGARVVEPIGAMVHFDDSASDKSGEDWFKSPDCKNGYNRYYLDTGEVVQLTPSMVEAARHAGRCKQKNANSSYYGLAIAAKDGDTVTQKQFATLVADIVAIWKFHGWGDVARLVGHDEQAVFEPGHPKAGQLGRKCDPTGTKAEKPVLSMAALREAVRVQLGG